MIGVAQNVRQTVRGINMLKSRKNARTVLRPENALYTKEDVIDWLQEKLANFREAYATCQVAKHLPGAAYIVKQQKYAENGVSVIKFLIAQLRQVKSIKRCQ